MDRAPGPGQKTQLKPKVPARPGMRPGGKPGASAGSSGKGASVGGDSNVRPPWYKRKYLVYPKFQVPLILLNTMITGFLFGLVGYLVIRSHLYLEQLVKQTRLPAQNLFIQLLTEQLRTLLIYMVVALGIALTTTAVFTLLLTHRMAGPLMRLKGFFGEVAKSSEFPDSLKFRDGDYFQDLPPAINGAFGALKKKWFK
jgi:hypothetical protein